MPATAAPAPTWTFRSSADPVLTAQPNRVATALTAHADQKARERLLLYSLVFAAAPARVLEIGVRWGGAARIIHAALSDLGQGRYVGIDPQPAVEFDWDSTIGDRSTLIVGSSPDALNACKDAVGGLFDFVFIDGDHSEPGAWNDLRGVREITSPGAAVLLHDCYHPPVARAIRRAISELGYIDCGVLAATRNDGVHVESGRTVTYGGVAMLRVP
ncbi:MAG: class I SAM-dependent methyltransferase [Planctomycetes bacterium]|nr:class I SAM-dependent methyltransferase [Planctomycetota bacterium]